MRARSTADLLPVVFMAAVRDQTLMTEAAGMGSTAFIMKPLRKVSLTRALCRLIRRTDGSELESPRKCAKFQPMCSWQKTTVRTKKSP